MVISFVRIEYAFKACLKIDVLTFVFYKNLFGVYKWVHDYIILYTLCKFVKRGNIL